MAEERFFFDRNNLRHLLRTVKKIATPTQRVIKNKNFISELTANEQVVLDNSQFYYPSNNAWWVNIKESLVYDDSKKSFEFIIITGANPATVQISYYLDVKRDTTPLQPNSAYLFRMYGYGTQYQGGKRYGKVAWVTREKIG